MPNVTKARRGAGSHAVARSPRSRCSRSGGQDRDVAERRTAATWNVVPGAVAQHAEAVRPKPLTTHASALRATKGLTPLAPTIGKRIKCKVSLQVYPAYLAKPENLLSVHRDYSEWSESLMYALVAHAPDSNGALKAATQLEGGWIARRALAKTDPLSADSVIAVLSGESPVSKVTRDLVKMGPSVVEPLIDALKSDRVYQEAMWPLGEIGDARAIEPLKIAFAKRNQDVYALVALGKLHDAEYLPQARQWVAQWKTDSRMAARGALYLGELQDKPSTAMLVQMAEMKGLSDIEAKPLRGGPGKLLQVAAVYALGQMKDSAAVEPLTAMLAEQSRFSSDGSEGPDADDPYRSGDLSVAIPVALGKLGDARAVKPLIAAMFGKNYKVQQHAARALAQLGDKQAYGPLETFLQDTQNDRMATPEIVDALLRLDAKRAVPALAAWLVKRRVSWTEAYVAMRLGELGAPEALPGLETWLRRLVFDPAYGSGMPDTGRYESTARFLRQRGKMANYEMPKAYGKLAGKNGLNLLITVARAPMNWPLQLGAAEAMGDVGDPRAIPTLTRLLGHKVWAVREVAAQALGKIQAPSALTALKAAQSDGDIRVRRAAKAAIDQVQRHADGTTQPATQPAGR